MNLIKCLALALFFLLPIFFLFDSWKDKPPENKIVIGSKRFTESYVLGEILKQKAELANEAAVDYRPGLGNTGIVSAALKEGLIDVYPEYTGTIAFEILKKPELSSAKPELLNAFLLPLKLQASPSLGFEDNYALAMLKKKAHELGINTISDLASHPQLIFGFSPEFVGRSDGWAGLKKSQYAFPQNEIKTIDHSLSFEALMQNKIDVTDIYSTDPKINKYELKILIDDHHFFPSYQGVLLYRLESAEMFPETWQAFQSLYGVISTDKMRALNAEAELQGLSFHSIANRFVHGSQDQSHLRTSNFWDRLWASDFWLLTKQHLYLVLGALFPAIIVGIGLGILANAVKTAGHAILNFVGVVQTIPSLALLAFLIPIFKEIGTVPALVALFLYSLLPIVRNTYAGLANITSSQHDAALALGLPWHYRLTWIELPLAAHTILAGIKTAAVLNVGMATIAALIGAGGYGVRIIAGLALNDTNLLLAGAIPACFLAICIQFFFDLLDHCLIPRGMRQ